LNEKNRNRIRRSLMFYLDCIDTSTSLEIGKVIDITYDGLLILSEHAMKTEVAKDYRIILPSIEPFKELKIKTRAICRWSRREDTRDLYYNGLEILEKSADFNKTVDLLVEKIGFSNGQKKISISVGESKYK